MTAIDSSDTAFRDQVVQLGTRVAQLREDAGSPDADTLLASALLELETAGHQLEVAAEELRVQQEEIDRASGVHGPTDDLVTQLFESLPVALLVCGRDDGMVMRASAEACAMLGRSGSELVGMPLPVVLPPDHRRRQLRTALSRLAAGSEREQVHVQLAPPGSGSGWIRLTGVRGTMEDRPVVRWVISEAYPPLQDGGRDPEPADREPDRRAPEANLAPLATRAVSKHSADDVAALVARTAQRSIPRATCVSVTLDERSRPVVRGASSPRADQLERLQEQLAEGPGAEARARRSAVRSGDLAVDARWRAFGRLASELGVASVIVLPLVSDDKVIGTLSVYGDGRTDFDDDRAAIPASVARAVTPALEDVLAMTQQRRLVEQLTEALSSRAVIDQARGIIMAQTGCTEQEAFDRLKSASQRENVKLRFIAARLVNASRVRH